MNKDELMLYYLRVARFQISRMKESLKNDHWTQFEIDFNMGLMKTNLELVDLMLEKEFKYG